MPQVHVNQHKIESEISERWKMKISMRLTLAVAVITSILFLLFNQNKVQIPEIKMLQLCNCQSSSSAPDLPGPMETDAEIERLFDKIDKTITKVTINDLHKATSPEKSTTVIINPKAQYCLGDQILVEVTAYDYSGNRKSYGGDYLRARIYSPGTNSSASGTIIDNKDGTYLVKFTLFWVGSVHLSILLMHPSEAVSALWRARNQGFANIKYTGNFTSATEYVNSECGFVLDTEEEICRYVDKRDHEAFYCIKPKDYPCEALTHMNSVNRDHSYLTEVEKILLNRSNIGFEIFKDSKPVTVLDCGQKKLSPIEKCSLGSNHPIPSGYFHYNVWHPIHCQMAPYMENNKLKEFLKGKKLFLMGDSTVRQYIRHFAENLKFVDYFNHTEDEMQSWQKTLLAINLEKFIYIQWKKHTFPFVSKTFYSIKEDAYMARQIDQVGGGENTIIVLTLGQHFRPFPLRVFIRSAINVRKAVERLLIRSPRTKVIIKEENARDMDINMERFSDFHGYVQYVALRDIFHGLNVGFVDGLDMTIAYACDVIHPPLEVLENIISMSFTQAS
ncbi:NXPE family member 4-like [Leptodactylus fuscus]|uniref:NXPE family member 4-like n=1 Tax=Leptodactylus fuscus TaxID=238119 RepID=UPI003F4EE53B